MEGSESKGSGLALELSKGELFEGECTPSSSSRSRLFRSGRLALFSLGQLERLNHAH
jgi:hypothetical protein